MKIRRFHGIIPPLVTPLSSEDTLDQDGLRQLLEHVIGGGVHGIFILGTTGEAPSLSYHLRRELITRVCEYVAGRVPVLVGVTDTSLVESVALAKHAAAEGAAAVVLAAPYYFPAGQTELLSYVTRFVEQTPLPLMLYNMPSLTKIWFEWDTLLKLAELAEVIGIKDSSGDLEYFTRLMSIREHRPDWSIMVGQESLLPMAIRLGSDGGVAGGANVFPSLFVDCYQACLDGQTDLVSQLSQKIQDFQQIYEVGKYLSRFIKGTKCCLSLLDICDDFMAPPFHRFEAPERQRVSEILAQHAFPYSLK